MLQSRKITSNTEVERMFQHPLAHQTGEPATHRGKGKNKFPIPTEYCHQPTIEAQKLTFLYLYVTDLDVFRELSQPAYRSQETQIPKLTSDRNKCLNF
jgi:hypothetical protein